MTEKFKEIYEGFHQFKKLNLSSMLPELSGNDFHTLMIIECVQKEMNGEGVRVSELAKKMRVTPPAASRTLGGLEDRGLVERIMDKRDRRNTYVNLTEQGREQLKNAENIMEDFSDAVFNRVDEADLKRLLSYLSDIYQIAEEELEKRGIPPKGKKVK